MASIAKSFFLVFLLFLLSSLQIHARDGQFFNKVPSNNGEKETQTVVPNKEQEPNFIPENENGAYGLYGHDSVSSPTTSTNNPNVNNLPNSKYLPKNYNPVSYVTVAEDNNNENNFNNDNNNNEFSAKHTVDTTTTSNTHQFYTAPSNYRNNNNQQQQQYYHGVSDFSTKNHNQQQQFHNGGSFYSNNQQYYNNDNNNNYNNNGNDNQEEEYYNAGNSYYNNDNEQQQGFTETRLSAKSYNTNPTNYNNNYQEQSYSTNYGNNYNNNQEQSYNTGNANYRVHKQQGMSDTRFLGNGKFYYDINAGRHARDPYENAKEFEAMNQQYNNRNTFGNNEYNNFENEDFLDENMN